MHGLLPLPLSITIIMIAQYFITALLLALLELTKAPAALEAVLFSNILKFSSKYGRTLYQYPPENSTC
jgi:hypothetical protein